jgi:hypothetical protein
MAGMAYFTAGFGADLDRDFCGRGRIRVERKGRHRPLYALAFNGQDLAELHWRGPRRAYYKVVNESGELEMRVGTMKRKIRAVDNDGRISKLLIPSNKDMPRRDIRLQMCDGANFIIHRKMTDRWGAARFEVRKQHYPNSVLVFHFDHTDPDAPILVDVERLMRWEMPHFHRLLALVTARIALERRMNGSC